MTATTRSTTGDYYSATGEDLRSETSDHQLEFKNQGSQISTLPVGFNLSPKWQFNKIMNNSIREYYDGQVLRSITEVDSINEFFDLGKVLGQGTYGVVRKATCTSSGAEVAIKIIDKKFIFHSRTLTAYLESELQVLQEVTGPYVINVYTIVQDSQSIFIITELASQGDLLQYLLKFNNSREGLLSEA